MHCPQCDGELDPTTLRSVIGDTIEAKRCSQCGGFWFEKDQDNNLSLESVQDYDVAQPNYSMQSYNLVCPVDQTLLNQSERDAMPNGLSIWSCPECEGTFYPRGQLALTVSWQAEQAKQRSLGVYSRSRVAVAVILMGLGTVAFANALTSSPQFLAAEQTLPTQGPNILALIMLALAYLAGTVLAVLGRKLPVVFLGWGVIILCLFSFSLLIFSP